MRKPNCNLKSIGAYFALAVLGIGATHANAQERCINGGSDRQMDTSGIYWQLWSQDSEPTSCMTPRSGMTFGTRWGGMTNHLARRGLFFGEGHGNTYQDYGGFFANYRVQWEPEWVDDGNSNISIYGWTRDPVAEFYITENWYQWNHGMPGAPGDPLPESFGNVIINGHLYELIRVVREGKPTPWGNMTFPQYVSVRKDRGSDQRSYDPVGEYRGKINIGQHFAAWQKTGEMPMTGELYEVAFNVESWNSRGSAEVEALDIYIETPPQSIAFDQSSYSFAVGSGMILDWEYLPSSYGSTDVTIMADNYNIVNLSNYKGQWYVSGKQAGTTTLTIYDPTGIRSATATVTVVGSAPLRSYEFRAHGTLGDEQIHVLVDGNPVDAGHVLTTEYQTYTGTIAGEGEVSIEFVNDDNVAGGRDVRLDYIEVDGERRETESMTHNNAAYDNGVCGGGAYTEWLHCNGSVNYGEFEQNNTITIRARGNAGGEHINLLINGQPVNSGWWLGTSFQEYTATVKGDGDINVAFDNDGGQRDVVIDWVKVNDQNPRQAENMEYNTGAWANGQCGGGSFTGWLHCNGVIGFGNISDNFE